MSEELIAGRYRLLEPLGRGAMSAVWEAEDLELARRVAVKTLAPSADRQRFEREARAVAALSHPNIVAVYDYGASEGRPFMVLECLAGGSLEERLSGDRPLSDDETRRIAADVAAGLAHAHERGLVHRDLKPANILFDAEGRAKIADSGSRECAGPAPSPRPAPFSEPPRTSRPSRRPERPPDRQATSTRSASSCSGF